MISINCTKVVRRMAIVSGLALGLATREQQKIGERVILDKNSQQHNAL